MQNYDLPQTRPADVSFIVRVWMRKLTKGKIKSHFRCLPLLKTLSHLCELPHFLPATHTKVTKERRLFVGEVDMLGSNTVLIHASCTVVWGRSISGALFMWPSPTSGFIFHDLKMLEYYSADIVGWNTVAGNAQNLNLLKPLKREQICAPLWHSCLSLNSHVM